MFNKISPEKAGIPSRNITDFINTLNSYNINTHSIIMAKGNNIIAEAYYEPFNKDTLHRMYSVSKSFVSIAIGLAEQEGLLSLDDKFTDYFPEYQNQNIDKKYRETTIRDMLTMRSCMAKYSPWWETDDRAKAYFNVSSNLKISGEFSVSSPCNTRNIIRLAILSVYSNKNITYFSAKRGGPVYRRLTNISIEINRIW